MIAGVARVPRSVCIGLLEETISASPLMRLPLQMLSKLSCLGAPRKPAHLRSPVQCRLARDG